VLLQNVLRRLRAYQCLDALQSTVGPMLAGKVNALLLSPPDFCAHVGRVAAAASDLATLVLQPPHSRQSMSPTLKAPQASGVGPLQLQPQRQDADACVLQLMLGFRVLDLLAAFVVYIGVHVCRLVQLQEQLFSGVYRRLCLGAWSVHGCAECCLIKLRSLLGSTI
jgi:hypothetical protein